VHVRWGTQEREAAAPKARSSFSGGTSMGEPERKRRRQTKQRLRRPQGAGIWSEAVPRNEGQIRIMTFLDAPQGFVGVDEDHDQPPPDSCTASGPSRFIKPRGLELPQNRSRGFSPQSVEKTGQMSLEPAARWFNGMEGRLTSRIVMDSLRAVEKQTLEMIADGAALGDVLTHLCDSIDSQVSPSVSTVLLMDGDGKHLILTAGPRVPAPWAAVVSPRPVTAECGLCGRAAFFKKRIIVTDVATCPEWSAPYRDHAIRSGIRAAWSQPILTTDNEVLGTFALYSPKPCIPLEADLALIDRASRIALIAIERQRSQEALRIALDEIRNSEANLRQVIDTIPALVWCTRPDGSNEFLNKRWHDYTGFAPEESRVRGWQPSVHPEDLPRVVAKGRELLASGEPGEVEARLRRHDGVFRWFLIRAEPLRDETGKIVRWYGTQTDIEVLKQTEEQVREEERELRRITDAIPHCIVVRDPRGVALYANQATLDYTGLTIEDLLDPSFRERTFHPDDVEKARDERNAGLAGGLPFETVLRIRRKDGQYRWFLVRYNPFRDQQGRVIRWYATGTDIDDRVKAEEKTRNENLALREQIDRDSMFEDIVGSSKALSKVLGQVAKVAPSDSTVLILGETGTGKE
jgi:PAS domain S-box-containing protein